VQSGDGNGLFLSTLPPERRERRLALGVIIVSAATFLCSAPFAEVPLGQMPAFIPIYQSALTVNDFVAAIILLGQFAILRSRRLAILASAYFFTACMAMIHLTSFPGLFSPTGLLGAGPQTTAWLYMFWHGGFPLLLAAYAVLPNATVRARPTIAILGVIIGAVAGAAGCTVLATAGQNLLPSLMEGTHYTSLMIKAIATVWSLSLLALAMLWRRRPHSVLDLWLMVVMFAWLFGIGQGS
jgi:Membrane-associated sensor, integral membrane domain